MKVFVYDLMRVLEEIAGSRYSGFAELNALIEGETKIILTDNEAVHSIHDLDDSIHVLYPNTKKAIDIPIRYLLTTAIPVDEIELGQFVRVSGHINAIEKNYVMLLNSIKEIGLNPSDFPRTIL